MCVAVRGGLLWRKIEQFAACAMCICFYKLSLFFFILYEACAESKDISHVGRKGNFLCLKWQHCHWPWSFKCEQCSFDSDRTGFVWVRHVWNGSTDPKSHQMRGAFRHYDFSMEKVNVQRKFTNKLLLFMVTLWIGKTWGSGAVNSPKEGLMFMMNKGAVSHLWSLTNFFRKLKEKFAQINAWW
jgi:hypothetical protein